MEDSPFWIYFEKFIPKEDADSYFQRCMKEVKFEQWKYEYEDKVGPRPRLSKFYKANEDSNPQVIQELMTLMNLLLKEEELQKTFNIPPGIQFDSVLVHCYRDGKDHIAKHSDKEAKDTFVFGLSLGAVRKMRFRCIRNKALQYTYDLQNGSLYIMRPGCQELFTHEIVKTLAKNQPGPRISLTFRHDNKPYK
jgi:alkylated DNA repair dioxygenase AlkB